MPELQRTIENCGLSPAVAPIGPIGAPEFRPPVASYCECGAPAIVENANGSACADCDEEFGNCVECNDCNEWVDRDDSEQRYDNTVCSSCAENYSGCEDCECDVHHDDANSVNDRTVCDSCLENNYTRCSDCNEYGADEDNYTNSGSTVVCASCYESHWTTCEDCDCLVDTNGDCQSDNHGNTICQSCYEDHYFYCDGCSETCHNNQNGRTDLCESCWDNLDCDERAERIVEHEHGGGRTRIEYRDRPASAASAANPVRSNRPSYEGCCVAREFAPAYNGCSRTGSYRTYGVELETSSCPGAAEMSGRTAFLSKADGTVTGWEFNSAVLNGDAGLAEIDKFCELAEEYSFAVDSKCGFHAHFGVGELSDEQRYNVAIAYWMFRDVWTAFVSSARRANNYSSPIEWRPIVYAGTVNRIECANGTSHDLRHTDFTDFARDTERRHWLNVTAFAEHTTFEVRLHSGTISAKKVNMWVIAHLRFIEFVANLSREAIVREFHNKPASVLFAGLLELMPPDVATHLTERAELFGTTWTESVPVTTDCVGNLALAS